MKKRLFPFLRGICVSVLLLQSISLGGQPAAGQTPFSQDSAYVYLKVLAEEIGPRPMGSPNERAALLFAVRKFRQFGLHESFLMPMREAVSAELGRGVNTNSGIAVGVLRGKTDRIILIGGHIDSSSPDVPGANDDASGSAVVIELARVLARDKHESTIVFALFGGEEQGLRGSRYFVENFDRMEHVALMLQIDMANGTDWLLPLVDCRTHSSPTWLVRASYEELEKLGYAGLSFPTHFYAFLDIIPGGGIGSDHQPFLERNIPAIDFTTDVSDPIHTPQDNVQNFKLGGLARSGDLVYNLVQRFDTGLPETSGDRYYLLQAGSLLLFVPIPLLAIITLLSIAVAGLSLYRMRRRRQPEDPKSKIPGLKLFLPMLIIQVFVWYSENIVAIIKGTRFPWLTNIDGYYVLGLLGAVVGIWVSLRITPGLRLSKDSYRYALRSVIFLLVFILLLAVASIKLALYPAVSLLLISLSFLVRSPFIKILLWLASPYMMFRLIFSEGLVLFSRSLTLVPAEGNASLYLHIFYVLFFSLWSFPFLLAITALRIESSMDLLWLSRFRRPAGGIAAAALLVGWIGYLATLPSYSREWKQLINVRQTVDLNEGRGFLEITSNDYLRDTRVKLDRTDTLLRGRVYRARMREFNVAKDDWISVDRKVETSGDTNTTFSITLEIRMKYRPYTLSLMYAGGTSTPRDVSTPFIWSPGQRNISMRWYSFPETLLVIPLHVTVVGADTLKEYLDVTFVEGVIPVGIEKELANPIRRTVMTAHEVIKAR